QPLLCLGPREGRARGARERRRDACQHRQPARGDGAPAGPDHPRAVRFEEHHRVPRASGRRPATAQAGHLEGAHPAGLGTRGRIGGRSEPDPGILPAGRMSELEATIRKYIRDVPDFPQPGIIFKDITPLFADKAAFKLVIDTVCSRWADSPPDLVAAIEARGFIPGGAVARALGAGFIPIRKPGKLPWKTVSQDYQLEYGTDQLQVHEDAVQPGQSVLIVDDVLATGGTSSAAV